ncbi:uroporphyrinogen decarboxylase [Ktedonosporobacter rubrisoli]|uniref:Uroporphyrinogen decarboxylase n=1 Tax=Ktedonosporobacter rubrisoli TaxID=2509675 RepID=A0A4V0Z031_KTERU|nr:uroporphyrinogen decarboxylase family protein [Ktedonosporobacter rubrisoli]QBD81801.1 uroporphyrinogen decarboxylase [Ktedonosporobacter rubrisoli]
MSTMTPGERVHAAVKGEAVDRVPILFWHHFKPEGSGERLAEYTLDFFVNKFKLDIIKIMPDLPYPAPEQPITQTEQMRFLPRLDLDTPIFQEQLRCIRTLRSRVGNDYPIILTLFSPLTYGLRFMGRPFAKTISEIRKNPAPFEEGLGTIASNLRRLMAAAIEAGASGIFFSCMGATSADFTLEEYFRFGRPYDLDALDGAKDSWLTTVHVHADPDQQGDQIYFDAFTYYPVSVISWSDRLTGPSLSEASKATDKCLMTGLAERGPLTHGSEAALKNEMQSAISQTNGRRLILANGCSIPDDTPEEWLQTARRLVDTLG